MRSQWVLRDEACGYRLSHCRVVDMESKGRRCTNKLGKHLSITQPVNPQSSTALTHFRRLFLSLLDYVQDVSIQASQRSWKM